MEAEDHILDSLVEQEQQIETYFSRKYYRLILCNACMLSVSLICIVYIYCSQT